MPAVLSALDVVVRGDSFSCTDSDFFWNVMARYAPQWSYPIQNGYVVLTPEELKDCAKAVFADFEKLPAYPDDSNQVIYDADAACYLLKKASTDLNVISAAYDDVLTIKIRDGGTDYLYQVVLKDGAIQSIKAL